MLSSWLFFLLSLYFQNLSGKLLIRENRIPIGDLFHNILPLINVNLIVTYGYLLLSIILIIYIYFKYEKIFPATLITISLLIILRAITIHFTYMGAAIPRIDDHNMLFPSIFYYSNDLFFSGHVGLMSLGFFILEKDNMKWLFFFGTIILAIGLLLMRLHYSIDIFAAPFITYGVYILCKKYLWSYLSLDKSSH